MSRDEPAAAPAPIAPEGATEAIEGGARGVLGYVVVAHEADGGKVTMGYPGRAHLMDLEEAHMLREWCQRDRPGPHYSVEPVGASAGPHASHRWTDAQTVESGRDVTETMCWHCEISLDDDAASLPCPARPPASEDHATPTEGARGPVAWVAMLREEFPDGAFYETEDGDHPGRIMAFRERAQAEADCDDEDEVVVPLYASPVAASPAVGGEREGRRTEDRHKPWPADWPDGQPFERRSGSERREVDYGPGMTTDALRSGTDRRSPREPERPVGSLVDRMVAETFCALYPDLGITLPMHRLAHMLQDLRRLRARTPEREP